MANYHKFSVSEHPFCFFSLWFCSLGELGRVLCLEFHSQYQGVRGWGSHLKLGVESASRLFRCWQNSVPCDCRTEVPTLLTVSQGLSSAFRTTTPSPGQHLLILKASKGRPSPCPTLNLSDLPLCHSFSQREFSVFKDLGGQIGTTRIIPHLSTPSHLQRSSATEGTYSQLLGIWALAIARATLLPHSLCYEGAYINHVQGHMKRKRPLAPPTIQANPADVPDTTEHGEAIPTMPT